MRISARTLRFGVLLLAATLPISARAAAILESESNDTLATAQNIDGYFSLDPSIYIGDGATSPSTDTSTTIPHVTITGSGNGTFDYYAFTYPGPGATSGTIHVDIDLHTPGFDSWVGVWDSTGNLLGHNDDYDYRGGRSGSTNDYGGNMSLDSFMTAFLLSADTYIVGVAQSPAGPAFGGFTSGAGEIDSAVFTYTLQISVENVPLPEPASIALLGVGSLLLMRRRR
jgi:hypothetical protein